MTTLRIFDLIDHHLAFDLKDLMRLLAPRSLSATWTVGTVKSPQGEWFEATGCGGEQLEKLSGGDGLVSGAELAAMADNTWQVIWGEFVGSLPSKQGSAWVTIRAIDSTYYEIETEDTAVRRIVYSTFKDVRTGEPARRWSLPK